MEDYSSDITLDLRPQGGLGWAPSAQPETTAEAGPAAPEKVKLTEAEAKTIKARLDCAEKYNKKHHQENWERSLELYKGEHFANQQRALRDGAMVVNYVLHTVDTKVASIAFRYPEFTLVPLTSDAQDSTEIGHSALRYEWRTGKVQREARRALKDKEIFGTGITLTGWLFETESGMKMEDGRHPIQGEETDTTPDFMERPMVATQEVRQDRFLAKRINPGCFLVDPECGRVLDEAEFCGYWELRPLSEVKKQPHFKNVRQLKGCSANMRGYFSDSYLALAEDDVPCDLKRVKLFHYYERRRRLHAIFCNEHDKPLYVEKWNWETDIYPFRYLQGPGDEDCFFGMSPTLLIEAPQMELNEARSQLRRHRKMAVPRYQTRTGNLSRQAKEQLKDCVPLGVVETNGDPITQIPQQPIQQEVYQTEGRAVQDMTTLAALDQYQLGRPPSKRTTTTEVEAIQSLGGARAMSDRQQFEEFCAEIALDCLNWLKQYSVKTRELPIYDDNGNIKAFWPDFTGEQIRGQFDIEVFVGSTQQPNNADILEGMAFWTQSFPAFLQSVIQASQVGIDLTELVRESLKAIPGIRNIEKIMSGFKLPGPGQPPGGELPPDMGGSPAGPLPEGQPPMSPGMEQAPPEQGAELPPDLLAALMAAR